MQTIAHRLLPAEIPTPFSTGGADRDIGNGIRTLRLAHGLSIGELATLLRCDPALILDYEAGSRRLDADILSIITQALSSPCPDPCEQVGRPCLP